MYNISVKLCYVTGNIFNLVNSDDYRPAKTLLIQDQNFHLQTVLSAVISSPLMAYIFFFVVCTAFFLSRKKGLHKNASHFLSFPYFM